MAIFYFIPVGEAGPLKIWGSLYHISKRVVSGHSDCEYEYIKPWCKIDLPGTNVIH